MLDAHFITENCEPGITRLAPAYLRTHLRGMTADELVLRWMRQGWLRLDGAGQWPEQIAAGCALTYDNALRTARKLCAQGVLRERTAEFFVNA